MGTMDMRPDTSPHLARSRSGQAMVRAILQFPAVMTVGVPAVLLAANGMNVGWWLPVPFNIVAVSAGLLLIGLGILVVAKTITHFDRVGRGTLAPWAPPHRLVVHGIYRHVRNPMIGGVFMVLLGEAILFGSISLWIWFAVFLLVNLMYIPLGEEPGLARRFGQDYLAYKQNVPRWIPSRRPWAGP